MISNNSNYDVALHGYGNTTVKVTVIQLLKVKEGVSVE
jgi:hypothetical protein